MYLAHFGLTEKPFAITPDPRYLYLSARHADALAHLVYGLSEAGGFIQLTGEVGTGKTTIIRSLLARAPKDAEIALILNPRLSASEFLQTLCEELGLGGTGDAEGQTKGLVDLLNRYLLRAHARGRRVALIVDEAQNLSPEVLEQVRLLTNLETETQKLLQIILIGQPELRRLLARDDLRQLAQRITGRCHLDPLSREETAAYVRHRLRVAGATTELFTRAALREVYRVSGGVPRVINIVSDRALLGAYSADQHQVSARLVRRAGAEVFGHSLAPGWLPTAVAAATLALVAASAVLLWHGLPVDLAPRLQRLLPHPVSAEPRPAAGLPGGRAAPAPVAHPASPTAAPRPGSAQTSVMPGTSSRSPAAPAADAAAGKAAAPAAAVALGPLLKRYQARTDLPTAFGELFSLWKSEYRPAAGAGCLQALRQGLHCLVRRGSLAELRQLNRPAILKLRDAGGRTCEVVLSDLGPSTARLHFGKASAVVPITDLTHYWYGRFVLLWRPGAMPARELSVGMRGAPVLRLRELLDRWRGQPHLKAVDDRYDATLVNLVKRFQRANRLTVDGVAGLDTQVALDAALATPGSPVLHDPSERGG